jgi:hypothetical protein
MQPLSSSPPAASPTSSDSFRSGLRRSAAYWEPHRWFYNLVLSVVAITWVLATWPHFRPMPLSSSLLLLAVLAFLANVCYTAAYFLELPLLHTPLAALWIRWRWSIWLLGTLLAVLFENYWISDEIYPFVH